LSAVTHAARRVAEAGLSCRVVVLSPGEVWEGGVPSVQSP